MDWHRTQNNDYIELLKSRLEQPKLKWVDHFVEIISERYNNYKKNSSVLINDIGCSVGHFYRGVKEAKYPFDLDYCGYDVSETYLEIAKSNFANGRFELIDISQHLPRHCDITVMSATLEHIPDHNTAIQNVFSTTDKLVIIRTFLGDNEITEECTTYGAEEPYLIKQFCLESLVLIPCSYGFRYSLAIDKATNSKPKLVCNGQTVLRQQRVIVFQKEDGGT